MKIRCGPTYRERIAAKERWHEWFAWHPVRIVPNDCRWLETVERLGHHEYGYGGDSTWIWKYRSLV